MHVFYRLRMCGERDTGQAGCINSYVMINIFTGVTILSFIKIFAFFFACGKHPVLRAVHAAQSLRNLVFNCA